MHSIKHLYEEIYDFENLHIAWQNARHCKRYREDVLLFDRNYEEHLIEIQNELIWETYEVGKYHTFYVYEPKKRLIMSLPFRDRIVQWAIYRKLFPIYDKTFIYDSYACREGKGTHKAADRLQYWLRQTDRRTSKYYYLKLDISKYFYRVDHQILLSILSKKIKDEPLMRLLDKIINCEDTNFGLPLWKEPDEVEVENRLPDKGIPIGNLTSQMFANIYLHELDMYCKCDLRLHYYIRYMDDVVILHHDKKYLAQIKDLIEAFLDEHLRLNLNNKTTIRPCSMGVDFVGFKIFATHRKLKKKTVTKIKNNLKLQIKKTRNGEQTRERLNRTIASYKGTLSHCNSYGLRQSLNKLFITDNAAKEKEKINNIKGKCTERKCTNCKYFHTSYFCGYESSHCDIFCSLDMDQKERHPDITGATCEKFVGKE